MYSIHITQWNIQKWHLFRKQTHKILKEYHYLSSCCYLLSIYLPLHIFFSVCVFFLLRCFVVKSSLAASFSFSFVSIACCDFIKCFVSFASVVSHFQYCFGWDGFFSVFSHKKKQTDGKTENHKYNRKIQQFHKRTKWSEPFCITSHLSMKIPLSRQASHEEKKIRRYFVNMIIFIWNDSLLLRKRQRQRKWREREVEIEGKRNWDRGK